MARVIVFSSESMNSIRFPSWLAWRPSGHPVLEQQPQLFERGHVTLVVGRHALTRRRVALHAGQPQPEALVLHLAEEVQLAQELVHALRRELRLAVNLV